MPLIHYDTVNTTIQGYVVDYFVHQPSFQATQ